MKSMTQNKWILATSRARRGVIPSPSRSVSNQSERVIPRTLEPLFRLEINLTPILSFVSIVFAHVTAGCGTERFRVASGLDDSVTLQHRVHFRDKLLKYFFRNNPIAPKTLQGTPLGA